MCVYPNCQALFLSGGRAEEDSDFVSLGVWLVGPLCMGVPIVKRARCRDPVCGAAIVGILCPIGIYMCILLQGSLL